jgi:transcriptional regulator with XRE-family HTH domain
MQGSRHEEHEDRWKYRSIPLPHLRELRRRKALTQKELSERAEVSCSTVRLLECGCRGAYPVTMKKLAEALGVPTAALTRGHRPKRKHLVSK